MIGISKDMMAHEAGIMRNNLTLQGGLANYMEPPPETSEYIREFSEDRTFEFDKKTGQLKGGNIP